RQASNHFFRQFLWDGCEIKVDMTQQYKCRGSDGTEVTDSKHIKISDSEKWKGPPQPPKKK
ncbi:MAG TPA: hypothetical protein PK953_12320, partial [Smithellaceae bacterium]|nr:hypothetical protein [Smithellaceae bacterium]